MLEAETWRIVALFLADMWPWLAAMAGIVAWGVWTTRRDV